MNNDSELSVVEQREVTFYENDVTAVRVVGGDIYVPIRPICEVIGVGWGSQYNRLQRDAVLSTKLRSVFITKTEENRRRDIEMICLPLEYLNGWLFGINANRVKAEIREQLIRYQEECYRVLAEVFLHNQITHRPDPLIDELLSSDDPMVDTYKMLMAMANMAREQIILRRDVADLQSGQLALDRRVQLIEANLGNEARFISNQQAMQISQAVKLLALEMGKRTGGNEFQGVWGELHRRYQISSYLKLPAVQFDEAIEFLREWWESLVDNSATPF